MSDIDLAFDWDGRRLRITSARLRTADDADLLIRTLGILRAMLPGGEEPQQPQAAETEPVTPPAEGAVATPASVESVVAGEDRPSSPALISLGDEASRADEPSGGVEPERGALPSGGSPGRDESARIAPDQSTAAPTPSPRPKLTARQRVTDCHRKHPDWTARQIAAHLGISLGTASGYLSIVRAAVEREQEAAQEALPPAPAPSIAPEPERPPAAKSEPSSTALTVVPSTAKIDAAVLRLHAKHPTWSARMIARNMDVHVNSVIAAAKRLKLPIQNGTIAGYAEPEFRSEAELKQHYAEVRSRMGGRAF